MFFTGYLQFNLFILRVYCVLTFRCIIWRFRAKNVVLVDMRWLYLIITLDELAAARNVKDKILVLKKECSFCDALTPEQIIQLATPTYQIRKERKAKAEKQTEFIDPAAATDPYRVNLPSMSPIDMNESQSYLEAVDIILNTGFPNRWVWGGGGARIPPELSFNWEFLERETEDYQC